MSEKPSLPKGSIEVENLIISIRGQRVIIDKDLARLYGTITKRLNEQIRRCLLYTSPSPRDKRQSRMPSSA